MDQLQLQLKEAHEAHAKTTEEMDALQHKVRKATAAARDATSDKELTEKRLAAANSVAMQQSSQMAERQEVTGKLAQELEKLKLEDASKTAALAEAERALQELRTIARDRGEHANELRAQLDAAQADREALTAERDSLTKDVHKTGMKRTRDKEKNATRIARTVEEMEARFELSEAEMRRALVEKSAELERARQRIAEMEQGGVGGGGGGGGGRVVRTKGLPSGQGQEESLREEVRALRQKLARFEAGKRELLAAVLSSRARAAEALAE